MAEQAAVDLHDILADIAQRLDTMIAAVRAPALLDGLTNAQALVRAAMLDARQRPLLGMSLRLLREFETAVGSDPIAFDARRMREQLAEILKKAGLTGPILQPRASRRGLRALQR